MPLLLGNNNYFNVLTVEEIPEPSAIEKDTPNQKPEHPTKPPRRPKWERRLLEKLEIDAAEPGSNSLYLRIEIESQGAASDVERKCEPRGVI